MFYSSSTALLPVVEEVGVGAGSELNDAEEHSEEPGKPVDGDAEAADGRRVDGLKSPSAGKGCDFVAVPVEEIVTGDCGHGGPEFCFVVRVACDATGDVTFAIHYHQLFFG